MSYAAATATAKRLLTAKGQRIIITRSGQGTADEIAGTRSAGTDMTGLFACVGLPPGKSAEFQIGSLIGREIVSFYLARVAGQIVNPLPGDTIPWGDRTYKIVWIATYDPDATGAILHQAYGEAA